MTGEVSWLTCEAADLPASLDWLAADERARLDGLRIAKRRADYLLGRWTAKQVIAARLSPALTGGAALAAIAIRAAADGAPEAFRCGAPLACTVSLSHSAGRALAVVRDAGGALGADLERVEPRSALLVDEFFTAGEAAWVAGCPPGLRDRAITLIWSAKESALKARRSGLREDPRRVRVELELARPPPAGPWHALRIAIDGAPAGLAGWWRDDGDYVLTVVGEAVAAPPAHSSTNSASAATYGT